MACSSGNVPDAAAVAARSAGEEEGKVSGLEAASLFVSDGREGTAITLLSGMFVDPCPRTGEAALTSGAVPACFKAGDMFDGRPRYQKAPAAIARRTARTSFEGFMPKNIA